MAWAETIIDSSISMMEVLYGARNTLELAQFGRFLSKFEHLHSLRQDSQWSVKQFQAFWLSHQIGIADCLIGSIAARTGLPLYTLNVKDFDPLPDVKVVRPY